VAGIYIHIPFCHKACHYCNFHFSTRFALREPLIDSILKEIELQAGSWDDLEYDTVYFGGGTPSAIPTQDIQRIMNRLDDHYNLKKLKEVPLEPTPEDITEANLMAWNKAGINRISMGIQSFQERDLALMNRNHDTTQAHRALKLMVDSDIDAVNADLIFGTPGLSDAELEYNIAQLIHYPIQHISAYALTVEPNTALAHQIKTKKVTAPDEDISARQFLLTHNRLSQIGFDHYEISNYGLPNHYAIHNTQYWDQVSYLGIGPAAHSYKNNTRWANVSHNKKYIDSLAEKVIPCDREVLSPTDQYNEWVMTQIRRSKGLKISDVEQYSDAIQSYFNKTLKVLLSQELISQNKDRIFLSPQQMLYADGVAERFMVI